MSLLLVLVTVQLKVMSKTRKNHEKQVAIFLHSSFRTSKHDSSHDNIFEHYFSLTRENKNITNRARKCAKKKVIQAMVEFLT